MAFKDTFVKYVLRERLQSRADLRASYSAGLVAKNLVYYGDNSDVLQSQ
jgi:hypothetical protein